MNPPPGQNGVGLPLRPRRDIVDIQGWLRGPSEIREREGNMLLKHTLDETRERALTLMQRGYH